MTTSGPHSGVPSQRGLLIRLISIIGLLLIIMLIMRFHVASHPPREYSEHLSPLPAPQNPQQTVETGLFVHNIYAFEADKKIFDADGWIWLKYSNTLHEYRDPSARFMQTPPMTGVHRFMLSPEGGERRHPAALAREISLARKRRRWGLLPGQRGGARAAGQNKVFQRGQCRVEGIQRGF